MKTGLLLSLGLLLAAISPAGALTVGVTPGALADSIETAAEEARAQGLDVKVVEFSDWATPNLALENGDLDVNYFQHRAFLDNSVKETGYKLADVGLGILPNIGLYSAKYTALDQLPEGARVAIASDPVNGGRGLALLQSAGLISLREGAGLRGTLNDVTANPKKLDLVEIEGPQLVRALSDVDLAQGYPAHFINAGQADIAGRALLFSGVTDDYFAIRFVTRENNAADPDVARFIRIYQTSPKVRDRIDASYAHNPALYVLPWTK